MLGSFWHKRLNLTIWFSVPVVSITRAIREVSWSRLEGRPPGTSFCRASSRWRPRTRTTSCSPPRVGSTEVASRTHGWSGGWRKGAGVCWIRRGTDCRGIGVRTIEERVSFSAALAKNRVRGRPHEPIQGKGFYHRLVYATVEPWRLGAHPGPPR